MTRLLLPLALAAALGACTQFPELDVAAGPGLAEAEPLPFLTTVEMAALAAESAAETGAEDPLPGRVARLRARAAALRGPVFSGGDRARLTGAPG
ncbi:MAG: hypothetical protein AAFP13_02975 [Pseudomonadota bacterium]